LRIEDALDRPPPGCAEQPPERGLRPATIARAIGAFGRPGSAVAAGNRTLGERIVARAP
jgi:hypothetical protein